MNIDQSGANDNGRGGNGPLEIKLEAVPSSLQTTGGRNIHFTRAILKITNTGLHPINDLVPRAVVSQEGGMPQEISEAMVQEIQVLLLAAGESRTWDLYDLLATGHPGVASKVHLFGYKAVLNWWFELSLQVDYSSSAGSFPNRSQRFSAKFRWQARPSALDEVDLEFETGNPSHRPG